MEHLRWIAVLAGLVALSSGLPARIHVGKAKSIIIRLSLKIQANVNNRVRNIPNN